MNDGPRGDVVYSDTGSFDTGDTVGIQVRGTTIRPTQVVLTDIRGRRFEKIWSILCFFLFTGAANPSATPNQDERDDEGDEEGEQAVDDVDG